jgi:hypothetical protein
MDDKLFQDLCNPWKEALVVKLLGKNVGFNLMKDRLKNLWRLAGGFEIMDVDNGFYMVKCERLADREKIMSNGPWMLFDHYLAVARWTPDFASPHAKIEKTLVWIRFPGLNLVYYDESVLLGLASVVGTPIKVDTNTLKVERGRFARICVEIDLTLPVVGKVNVNGHWYQVQYEGLHIICGSCGCYGHHTRDCKQDPGQKTPANTTTEHQGSRPDNIAVVMEPVIDQNKEKENSQERGLGNINETHGEWLVVQRKKKQIKKGNSQPPSLANKLANKLPNSGGRVSGKNNNISFEGNIEKNGAGVGPKKANNNTKKRRISADSRLANPEWGPRARELSSKPATQRVTIQQKDKTVVNCMEQQHVNISSFSNTFALDGDIRKEAFLDKQNNSSNDISQNHDMDIGSTQDDERVPESPIHRERSE